jgi:hypothetical protein
MIFYFLFIADGLERRRAKRLRREEDAGAPELDERVRSALPAASS